jgi:hypothetical protein
MKKTILIASVTTISIIALFINVSLSRNSQTGNIDLIQLKATNEVSAECHTEHQAGGGKCLVLAQVCVGDPGNPECDFFW